MKKEQFLSRRVFVLIAVMGLWGTVIGARLYFLQVVKSSDFRKRALDQQEDQIDILAARGVIYDRNGGELAASTQAKSVFAVPKDVRDIEAAAAKLAPIIGQPAGEISAKLTANLDRDFVWIKRKLSDSEYAAIVRAKLPGFAFRNEPRRTYPQEELAAQVLGYVGIDDKGLGGLEGRYDDVVRGQPGKVIYISDGKHRSYGQIEQPAQPGSNLITTIDANIQHFVEQEVGEAVARTHARAVYVVVMDPQNGEILAMSSYPTFNPNRYLSYSRESLKNGTIDHTYEPGSTFKILTVGAALEEGLTDPEERIDCLNGAIIVAGQRIRDHMSFGVLSVSEILQKSSDVGAITLGLRLKEERMSKYIKLYGFGQYTGIDLPGEERGLTKSVRDWNRSSIGYLSMGQEIGVTPLQIASLISMVANGGTIYRPFVVKQIQDTHNGESRTIEPSGRRVMSLQSVLQMQDMLEKVVTDGTAKAARLDGYRAAGKTGTAQKRDDATGKYSTTKLVASFAGYAPVTNPSLAMVVVVDEPVGAHHGGEVAAPIFKNIADKILRYKGVTPDLQDYAPHYTAAPVKRPPPPVPATSPVDPRAGKIMNATFAANPYEAGDIAIPDFHGKSLRQIHDDCRKLGLALKSDGSGVVREQYPPAGALVRLGTVVEVQLSAR